MLKTNRTVRERPLCSTQCAGRGILPLSVIMLALIVGSAVAAEPPASVHYPAGARNAVSITFDDARASQVDIGLPILTKYQVRATFYLLPYHAKDRLAQWQQALQQGHELGSHTNSHLCTGNFQWLRSMNAGLEQVDLAFIKHDLQLADQFFQTHFKMQPQHFAYPCGQTFVGRGQQVQSYVPLIAARFKTGRLWNNETGNLPGYADAAQLQSFALDNHSFAELKQILEQQREHNKWLILTGHEVGDKGLYTTRRDVLEQLIRYLQNPANGYWLAPVGEVYQHLQQQQAAAASR